MQVRIYRPTKSAMQSGDRQDKWLLEFVRTQKRRFREELMGRTSSKDMLSEVKLEFNSLEAAIDYAKSRHYDIDLIKPQMRKLIKKSYASNFK